MEDLSIYIHIPFCASKCLYCDFTSFSNQENRVGEYIDSLITELSLYKDEVKNYRIKTIFIGGGTPSAIDAKYIYRILEYIYKNFNLSQDMETSMELNPGTLELEKLRIYKEANINRISIGLQTFDNNILKKLGRIHSGEDFLQTYEALTRVGFDNINVDLIFNLPDQTIDKGMKDVQTLVKLGVKHLSYYSLIIEPGTPLYKLHQENKLKLLDEDRERELYHSVRDYLKENGYLHYEISNFAREGYDCKHNMVYWKIKPYLGVGLSSHSFLNNKRFWNTSSLDDYTRKLNNRALPVYEEEYISREIEMAETCIFGIRLVEGIDKKEFSNRFDLDIKSIYKNSIDKHKEAGLLYEDDRHIKLTDKGLDLANLVEIDFLP